MTISKNNRIIETVSLPLFDAQIEGKRIEVAEPMARLKLNHIPPKDWALMLQFFWHVYEKYKSEALFYWFYNGSEWMGEPPVQFIQSASVTTEGYNNERDLLIKRMRDIGFEPCLTIHTHASMSAFQSGTDKDDETSDCEFSLHITLGKFNQDNLEWHCRAKVVVPNVVNGRPVGKANTSMVPFCITGLVDVDGLEDEMPDKLRSAMVEYRAASTHAAYRFEDNEFPDEWIERLFVPKVKVMPPPVVTYGQPWNHNTGNNKNKSAAEIWREEAEARARVDALEEQADARIKELIQEANEEVDLAEAGDEQLALGNVTTFHPFV